MKYFAPNLIPEHHMYSALITPDEFYAGIDNLKPSLAQHLLYVRDRDAVMVAPLYWLARVDEARMREEQSKPEYAKYLCEVTEQWVMIIARCAVDHPMRSKILQGIDTALCGDLPDPPAWTRAFDRANVTADDNQIYLPPKSQIRSPEEQQGWGLTAEPTADLIQVLDFLGYGKPEELKRGCKPKGNQSEI
jgi:hypothetical protein